MTSILIWISLLSNLLGVKTVHAETLDPYNQIAQYIALEAKTAQIDPQLALFIANNESKLRPDAKGDYINGVPTSFGLWQIHLPAHPEITKAQALDPIWSTEWAVNQLKEGHCKIWSTCTTPKEFLPVYDE